MKYHCYLLTPVFANSRKTIKVKTHAPIEPGQTICMVAEEKSQYIRLRIYTNQVLNRPHANDLGGIQYTVNEIFNANPAEYIEYRIRTGPVQYRAEPVDAIYQGFGRPKRDRSSLRELFFELEKLEETTISIEFTGTAKFDAGLTAEIKGRYECRIQHQEKVGWILILPNNHMFFFDELTRHEFNKTLRAIM